MELQVHVFLELFDIIVKHLIIYNLALGKADISTSPLTAATGKRITKKCGAALRRDLENKPGMCIFES